MKNVIPVSSTLLHNTDRLTGLPAATVANTIALGSADPWPFGIADPLAQQRKPAVVEPVRVEIGAAILLDGSVLDPHPLQVVCVSDLRHYANATG